MHIEEMMLAELEPELRELYTQLSRMECGASILRFFRRRPKVLIVIDDIVYYVDGSRPAVERALEGLIALDLLRRVQLPGLELFGLTQNPEKREAVCKLCAWQERWYQHLTRMASWIDGESGHE